MINILKGKAEHTYNDTEEVMVILRHPWLFIIIHANMLQLQPEKQENAAHSRLPAFWLAQASPLIAGYATVHLCTLDIYYNDNIECIETGVPQSTRHGLLPASGCIDCLKAPPTGSRRLH